MCSFDRFWLHCCLLHFPLTCFHKAKIFGKTSSVLDNPVGLWDSAWVRMRETVGTYGPPHSVSSLCIQFAVLPSYENTNHITNYFFLCLLLREIYAFLCIWCPEQKLGQTRQTLQDHFGSVDDFWHTRPNRNYLQAQLADNFWQKAAWPSQPSKRGSKCWMGSSSRKRVVLYQVACSWVRFVRPKIQC